MPVNYSIIKQNSQNLFSQIDQAILNWENFVIVIQVKFINSCLKNVYSPKFYTNVLSMSEARFPCPTIMNL